MFDQLIPKTAPIQSTILLLLAAYFGYQLFKLIRGMHVIIALSMILCIYYGYLLGQWKGAGPKATFIERLLAATVGAVIQLFLMLISAVFGIDVK